MMCRTFKVEPSILLHPLDFMGADDNVGLDFFPAMGMKSEEKLKLAGAVIDSLRSNFEVGTMRDHALGTGSSVTRKENAAGDPLASKQDDANPSLVGAGASATADE